MKTLAENSYSKIFKSNNAAVENLDYAINKSSDGLFKSTNDLKQNFMHYLSNTGTTDVEEVLLKGCGINFKNNDTGAITGLDTGGKEEKNFLSIIPEPDSGGYIKLDSVKSQIPNDKFIIVKGRENVWLKKNGMLPDLLMYFKDHDFTVKVDNYFGEHLSLNENEKIVVDALYNWWIEGALKLNKDSYGLGFNSPTSQTKKISLINNYHVVDVISNVLSSHSAYVNNFGSDANLVMGISTQYYGKLDLLTQDGRSGIGQNMPEGVNPLHYPLDRDTAHEFTHGIMAANIKGYNNLPAFIKEGLAELTIGADDITPAIKDTKIKQQKRLP